MVTKKNMPKAEPPSKALLCLHGAGTSGAIFSFQLAKLRLGLRSEFEFIFINAPNPSPAGPGVLPMFAEVGPFYRWFDADGGERDGGIGKVNNAVRAAIDEWESTKTIPNSKIVGVLAFSEGAVAATCMLWQQQQGQLPWLPPMHFAVLICCDFPDAAGAMMQEGATKCGAERALLGVPTLHIHGRQDWGLQRSRKLVVDHYTEEYAEVMEFEGGHHCPTKPDDCVEAAKRILRLSEASLGKAQN